MSLPGFEPAIPASKRLQAHALDRAATGIGGFDPRNVHPVASRCIDWTIAALSRSLRWRNWHIQRLYLELEFGFLDVTSEVDILLESFFFWQGPAIWPYSEWVYIHTVPVRSYLILFSHLRLDFTICIFLFGVFTKILCALIFDFTGIIIFGKRNSVLILLLWLFGPFSGHGLPDLLPHTFSFLLPSSSSVCYCIPPSTILPLRMRELSIFLRDPPTAVSENHYYKIEILFSNVTRLGFHRHVVLQVVTRRPLTTVDRV